MRTVEFAFMGLLALVPAARAQETAADPGHHGTMTQEEVKTWTSEINGKQYGVHPWAPSYEGTTGLFHMPVAYTLPKGKFSFSLFRDNLDRDPKDEDISIHGLSLGYGATDKLEIYGNFGLQNRIDADALFQAGFVNDYPFVATPWETGVGDIKLGLKYKFLDDYMGDSLGLAVRGFVKLPTADDEKGLGTGKPAFGADLVISKSLAEKADIHASLGYQVNSDPDDVDIGNALKWGVGLNIPACYFIQLQAELVGTKYSSDDSFEQTNPLDLVVGPIVWFRPGFFIRPALSWNLKFDDGGLNQSSRSWTGRQISIGYHPGAAYKEIYTPPPPPPPPSNGNPMVASCSVERSNLLPGESTGVRVTASDPDGDPLTYEWSVTSGSVSGTGPAVTFNSAGMAAGSSSTITVRVSDGRNGIGQATCSALTQETPLSGFPTVDELAPTDQVLATITLAEPPKPECLPAGFLSKLSATAAQSGCRPSRLPDSGTTKYNAAHSLIVTCSVTGERAGRLVAESIFLAQWLPAGGMWQLSLHASTFELAAGNAAEGSARYVSPAARQGFLDRKGLFGLFFKGLGTVIRRCTP